MAASPHLPTAGVIGRALLRHHAARALARCSATLRAAADALTRLRWRLEHTPPPPAPEIPRQAHGGVVPAGYAQGRADIQFTLGPPPPPEVVVHWLPRPDR